MKVRIQTVAVIVIMAGTTSFVILFAAMLDLVDISKQPHNHRTPSARNDQTGDVAISLRTQLGDVNPVPDVPLPLPGSKTVDGIDETEKSSTGNDDDEDLLLDDLPLSDSWSVWPSENGDVVDDRILAQLRYIPRSYNKTNIKFIYMPNGLGDLPAGRARFQRDRCPVDACWLTASARYERSAAIRLLQGDAFFDAGYRKPPGQIWVLWLLESPINTPTFSHVENLVNWTATYRPDSTIVTPYEKFVPYSLFDRRNRPNAVDNAERSPANSLGRRPQGKWPYPPDEESGINRALRNRHHDAAVGRRRSSAETYRQDLDVLTNRRRRSGRRRLETEARDYAAGKSGLVAWFVSNCVAGNRRYEYMQQLRQYVPVDVYGDCGQMQCSRDDQDSCDRLLRRRYKFYLSFENSNCEHYITEKFYRDALWNDVVPIVMGARKSDYAAVAPPNSFIHVDDFRSARDLAGYLLRLNASERQYNEYFSWKSQGQFVDTKFWCRLCALAHDDSRHVTWYSDVGRWWRRPGVCTRNRWDRPNDLILGMRASYD